MALEIKSGEWKKELFKMMIYTLDDKYSHTLLKSKHVPKVIQIYIRILSFINPSLLKTELGTTVLACNTSKVKGINYLQNKI